MPITQLKRTLEIATPGSNLSTRFDQLVITLPEERTVSVPMQKFPT